MKCFYHPENDADSKCSLCGSGLCNQCIALEENDQILCSRCVAKAAAGDVKTGMDIRQTEKNEREEKKTLKQLQVKKFNKIIKYGTLLLCLIILAIKIPMTFQALEEKQPLRIGTYETDHETDECIKILWNISKLIQEGKRPGEEFICPKSGKAFQIIESDTDIIVRNPAPELYGFKDIRVSKMKPVPELIK